MAIKTIKITVQDKLDWLLNQEEIFVPSEVGDEIESWPGDEILQQTNLPDMEDDDRKARIALFNDDLRKMLMGRPSTVNGQIIYTDSLVSTFAKKEDIQAIDKLVASHEFEEGNNPYGERDFGSFKYGKETIFFKFDYYNMNLDEGSPDPADNTLTTRVLTIMLASDY